MIRVVYGTSRLATSGSSSPILAAVFLAGELGRMPRTGRLPYPAAGAGSRPARGTSGPSRRPRWDRRADPTLEVTVKWLPKPVENPDAEAKNQAGMKPYTEKIIDTGRDVRHGADPRRHVQDGQPGRRERPQGRRRPAGRGQDRAVLDGPVRGHLGRVRVVGPGARQAAAGRAEGLGQPTGTRRPTPWPFPPSPTPT